MRKLPVLRSLPLAMLTALLFVVLPAGVLAASQEAVLHRFGGIDGQEPYSGRLIFDSAGNLYGTTAYGGVFGQGVAYEMHRGADGGWTERVLYNFRGGSDGATPYAGLIFDTAGNLFGTTLSGGDGCSGIGCGTAFELSRNGANWMEKVLYRFQGNQDGSYPWAGLTFDNQGNLFGTTASGGACTIFSYGTVFELTRGSREWEKSTIHSFCGVVGGQGPGSGGLVVDDSGNLYGAAGGGTYLGVVYRLHRTASGWVENVMHEFTRAEGYPGQTNLTFDRAGNLYGTGSFGGTYDVGTVWELLHSGGMWNLNVLYNFRGGTDGYDPFSAPVFDANGNLYGTTYNGGISGNGCFNACGTLYKLSPAVGGGWTESVVHRFGNGTDGYNPIAGVVMDGPGNLYGTTTKGGGFLKSGIVYQIKL